MSFLFIQNDAPAGLPNSIDFGSGFGNISTGGGGVGSFINKFSIWMLGIAGFIAGIMVVVNGIKLMTASGDPNKIKDAIGGIKDALLGFALALLAAGIVHMLDSML